MKYDHISSLKLKQCRKSTQMKTIVSLPTNFSQCNLRGFENQKPWRMWRLEGLYRILSEYITQLVLGKGVLKETRCRQPRSTRWKSTQFCTLSRPEIRPHWRDAAWDKTRTRHQFRQKVSWKSQRFKLWKYNWELSVLQKNKTCTYVPEK